MGFQPGARRGIFIDISENGSKRPVDPTETEQLERLDLMYRALCAMLYNYVPMSGHPGGSISAGRLAAGIVFDGLDYDISDPDRQDADILSYAAGHKTLGLYALWALRNEVTRIGAPELLPADVNQQLRLEDLLGFRRSPLTKTPLFRTYRVKPLDGHPTPATPFLRLATGASGVGVAASLGLAFGAADYYGSRAPRVHIIEGEGGLTPGRVAEAMAAAGTACLKNAILHVDWNQASIDSNHPGARRNGFRADHRRPARDREPAEPPADSRYLPHPQRLAVRHRGPELPRRRARPVRRRVFRRADALRRVRGNRTPAL